MKQVELTHTTLNAIAIFNNKSLYLIILGRGLGVGSHMHITCTHAHTSRTFTPSSSYFWPKLQMHAYLHPSVGEGQGRGLCAHPSRHVYTSRVVTCHVFTCSIISPAAAYKIFFFFRDVTPWGRPLGPPRGYEYPEGVFIHTPEGGVFTLRYVT